MLSSFFYPTNYFLCHIRVLQIVYLKDPGHINRLVMCWWRHFDFLCQLPCPFSSGHVRSYIMILMISRLILILCHLELETMSLGQIMGKHCLLSCGEFFFIGSLSNLVRSYILMTSTPISNQCHLDSETRSNHRDIFFVSIDRIFDCILTTPHEKCNMCIYFFNLNTSTPS